ncbi:uncharacterized protein DUF3168 [Pseudoroseicyclus aestuarii]|uniref:Uncharacterized protein DUF3168 n=2 Tax=Pseudoroseicyclus aestuarii TaxID=1795041 RepID=A0A318SM81_9RHOB|nr:uncharacterized protein DUF3168 [Pseudoroseicyclus aestuarii]
MALRRDPTVSALVGERVYDEPPSDVAFPYLRLGSIDLGPLRSDGAKAWDVAFSIEAHSRPDAGRVEASRIAGAVIACLDERAEAVPVEGLSLRWVQFVTSTAARAPDGKSYVAPAAFQAVLGT